MPSFISSKKKKSFSLPSDFCCSHWFFSDVLSLFFLDSYKQNHMNWVARTREYISCSPEKFKSKTSSELMPVQVCMSSKNDASVVVFMRQEASAHPLGSLLDRH